MKKLLALLLLSPLVVTEEVEYPVELTCELVAPIYISYDPVNKEGSIEFLNQLEEIKKGTYQINHRDVSINKEDDDSYQFSFNPFRFNRLVNQVFVYINRTTLQAYIIPPAKNYQTINGQCFIGFKEYTEKQI
ncbi:hypothetical protein N9B16_01260 [Gammaproteobacteria bacterium]|nr:hypothetical protein [Gammaproteobacteria bacterium]